MNQKQHEIRSSKVENASRSNRRWTFAALAIAVCGILLTYFACRLLAVEGQAGTNEFTCTLAGGVLVTSVAAVCVLLLTIRATRIEWLVADRTRELRESEHRFRRFVDNAGDPFFLRDDQGKILDMNRCACDSLGYSADELLSMNIGECFVPDNREQYEGCSTLPAERYPITYEGVLRRKDGSTFPVEVRLALLPVGDKRLLISVARDVTERKLAEEKLRKEQRLLREVLDLHERDRKLIAYEIHDGLAQQLTGSLYKLQSIDHLRQRDPDAAEDMFEESIRLLREALAETRRLISGLRPPILDESGVVDAIDYLISEQRLSGGPEIEFVHPPDFGRLAAPLEGAIFRIVQECLTNACRYSQSERVRVELARSNDRVRVEVRDWGIGFDPVVLESVHMGLRGIRERAQLLDGVAVIDSSPGQGACIQIDLPLLLPLENNGSTSSPS